MMCPPAYGIHIGNPEKPNICCHSLLSFKQHRWPNRLPSLPIPVGKLAARMPGHLKLVVSLHHRRLLYRNA